MADFEGREFAGGRADVGALIADVVSETIADGFEEAVDFLAGTFGDEFDTTVGEIADKAGDFVVACDRVSGVSEANALDVASVVDGVALRGHCVSGRGWEAEMLAIAFAPG